MKTAPREDLELLQGAVDFHVHTYPDTYSRLFDIFQAAEHARAVGMRALVVKDHNIPTTDRAFGARRIVTGIDVFGGIVLNRSVGGLNPTAVETAISYGAKVVWMPTLDGASFREAFGKDPSAGLSIFNEGPNGKTVLPEVREICRLVADADIVLATGHLSLPEIFALIDLAQAAGVRKISVTHPDVDFIAMPIADQKRLASRGVFLEYGFSLWTHYGGKVHRFMSPTELASILKEVGPQQCVMTSDSGQVENYAPVEILRVYINMMLMNGLTREEVAQMVGKNPRGLLGID